MSWSPSDMPDLAGRICVVTGGNGGLGLATMRELARHGATAIMAVRDLDKASAAHDSLLTELPRGEVEVMRLDLASLESVRSFAGDLGRRHGVVDILVNNAGVMAPPWAETADGFEMQFGVNHLGHFALTGLLLPSLLSAPEARVVNVTSFARIFRGHFDPAQPDFEDSYDAWQAYGQSKMANLWFTIELDRRLAEAGRRVRSVAAHPGLTHTGLQAESVRATGGGPSQRFWHLLARTVGATPEIGARPVLRAATDPAARGGELYGPLFGGWGAPVRRPMLASSRRPADLDALWRRSEKATGVKFPI